MRYIKSRRFVSLVLAFVFCIGLAVIPHENVNPVSAANGNNHVVRVGMYVATTTDSRLFSAKTDSSNGFEIGVSGGKSFTKLFSLNHTSIFILPHVNSDFQNGNFVPNDNGNIGAYSEFVSIHDNFATANAKANSMGGFVAVVKGGYEVRINPSNSSLGKNRSPIGGGLMVTDANGKILLTFEDTSRKFALRAQNGGSVSFPMVHRTGAVNTYDYMGFFEYSISEGRLFMINCIGLEDYTKCVMANEIGTNVSVETRKAFAVLARTVPMNKKHGDKGFDVCCNSACCQVYKGLHQMSAENNAIVESTNGLYCAYQGAPISVLYHNSNGGASCSSVAAWGGNEIPYLTTVFLDESGESDKWSHEFTKQEFYEYIGSRYIFDAISDDEISMKILEKDPYGSDYITVLSVSDGSGNTVEVRTSEDVRSACGFDSANFDISYSSSVLTVNSEGKVETQNVAGVLTADGYKEFDGFTEDYKTTQGVSVSPDKIIINGQGVGHGVGFSAVGSEQLAKDGYGYEYILQFFFNGTTLKSVG